VLVYAKAEATAKPAIVHHINELMVLNEGALHIHDASIAWFKSIEDIRNRLEQKGFALSPVTSTSQNQRLNVPE